MSDVLAEFVQPYSHLAEDEGAYRRLLMLAVAGWNAALYPPEQHEQLIEQLVTPERLDIGEPAREEVRQLLRELVERKRLHYGADRRFILEFDLQQTEAGQELVVATTLPGEGPGG